MLGHNVACVQRAYTLLLSSTRKVPIFEAVPIFANHTYKHKYYHICEKIGINLAYKVTQNIQANSNDGSK